MSAVFGPSQAGEYENPEGLSGRRTDLLGEAIFFGDFFFGPAKKKSLGRGSGRRTAPYCKTSHVHGCPLSRG
jgi:hypothetical protein